MDKDNYDNKISQRQIQREKKDYHVGALMHMLAQTALQLIFPGMFFSGSDKIVSCAMNTFISHMVIVEPLYYVVHRWLHFPERMKQMHSFHHMSVHTFPSTSLVQDYKEHVIYIATFGPAIMAPFFLAGQNHWIVICAYLVIFDLVNAYGHTNIESHSWIFESKWSPMRYLFYTPEFHLGHHAYYNANYGLFVPIFDHIFNTYREFKKPSKTVQNLQPSDQQDFVFIGHNGGLGHLLTCPEVSVYNVYDTYMRTWLPLSVEFLLCALVNAICRIFFKSYSLSRYLVDEKHIGRIICVFRTPIDYMTKSHYQGINNDIVTLIKDEYKSKGTRYFGLGNLNKMKQLNDGGSVIVELIKNDTFLNDKKIRIWTGDTLTAASVFNQVIAIPNINKVFYIGANGKIGKAVCELLVERNIQICIFSSFEGFKHPNVKYTQDITDMAGYKYVLIGKMLNPKLYEKARKFYEISSKSSSASSSSGGAGAEEMDTKFLLDYTVPFMPLSLGPGFHHIQIGVLSVGSKVQSATPLLKGHFDICMGTDENQIYPCHAGCIVNMLEGKEADETGDIDVKEMERLWAKALTLGLKNRPTKVAIE